MASFGSKNSEGKFSLVVLDSINTEQRAPWYKVLSFHEDPIVLSFGNDYHFHFDPGARRIVPDQSNSKHPPGVLLIRESGPLLRVFPPETTNGLESLDFDLADYSVSAPSNVARQVAVLDWSIRLDGAREADTPFFTFVAG